MSIFLRSFVALFALSFPLSAAHASDSCAQEVRVDVNGLVCDFCAQSIEKIFGKREGTENISVDLGEKVISLTTHKDHAIDDATLTTLITDSGYNVEKITRECSDAK